MIDTTALRKRILDLAIQGLLTPDVTIDEGVNSKVNNILIENEIANDIVQSDIPFEIKNTWCWIKLGWIMGIERGGSPRPIKAYITEEEDGINWIKIGDVSKDGKYIEKTKEKIKAEGEKKSRHVYPGDFLLTNSMSFGRPYITKIDGCVHDGWLILRNTEKLFDMNFLYHLLSSSYVYNQFAKKASGATVDNLNIDKVADAIIPLPPVEEQKIIVEKVEEMMQYIETIANLQIMYSTDLEVLKSKIIEAGIQGKLTEQLPEDGTAEELCKNHIDDIINQEEKILDIPSNWSWIKLGWAMEIERGGSPRPIKAFVTDADDGINWIKIGDVAKDGKYIYQTKEKIKPEGEQKSRKVYPGDFLLTNSMSFGRPYISKIEGCIHDGWLLLRNTNELFDLDYLYWLLSSGYAFKQFSKKAAGATVDNLNKDKVASAVIPLPPLSEQKRIANVIEEIMNKL